MIIMKKLLILIILFINLVFAQDISRYYQDIREDNIDKVRRFLPDLIRKYPHNPDVLFLSALVEPDGDKALLIYKDVMSQYPNSSRADDALAKIIEYMYTKGLYQKTIDYSKQLITKYPNSDKIGDCVYMILGSFNVMNQKDSVDYYHNYYLKRYPNMKLPYLEYKSVSTYLISDKPPASKAPVQQPQRVEKPAITSGQKWVLQVGAFGNPQNALALKNQLTSWGYNPYIQKIKGSKHDLLSVRVGNYASREEANRAGERLKALHHIEYIVIKRNLWE